MCEVIKTVKIGHRSVKRYPHRSNPKKSIPSTSIQDILESGGMSNNVESEEADVIMDVHLGSKPKSRSRSSKAGTVVKREGLRPQQVCIIREIYESENAYENFEQQLERALADSIETIVIEPMKLGDETARWISVGNCLHKTAVLAGIGSFVAAFVWPDKPLVFVPGTLLSALCTGLYSISWQFDPCCKYQVETDPRQLSRLSLHSLNSSSPVVLVRRDDLRRKLLHSVITFFSLARTGWKLYYPPMNKVFDGNMSSSHGVSQPSESGKFVVAKYSNYDRTGPSNFISMLTGGVGLFG